MSRRVLLVLGVVVALAGCNSGSDDNTPAYDRRALLEQAADAFIIPSYRAFEVVADSQAAAVNRLVAAPDEQTLRQARQAFKAAMLEGQKGLYFDFGPADLGNTGMLWTSMNTFPAGVDKIEQAIAAGQLPATASRYYDRRGFAALDYLLFQDSTQTAARLGADPKRRAYLQACAADIANRAHYIVDAWANYRTAFVDASGTEAGSGPSAYYNAWVYGYEVAKNLKVALPIGKMAGQSAPEPNRVEALYSGLGREALLANLAWFRQLYEGHHGDADGIGWADYLTALPGGPELVATTRTQLDAVSQAAAALPAQPLSQTAAGPDATLDRLNTEMQKTTRYLKADMSSLTGIAITFSSGDGD